MILFFAYADISSVCPILDKLGKRLADFDEVFILIDSDDWQYMPLDDFTGAKTRVVKINEDGGLCHETLPDSELYRLSREDSIFCINGGADHFRWALHNLAVALDGCAYRVVPGDAKTEPHVVEMRFE